MRNKKFCKNFLFGVIKNFKIKIEMENNLELSIVLLSLSKSCNKLLESLVVSQHNPEFSILEDFLFSLSSHTFPFFNSPIFKN